MSCFLCELPEVLCACPEPFVDTADDPDRPGRWRDGDEDLRDDEDLATLALRLAGPLPVPDDLDVNAGEDFRPVPEQGW